MMNPVVLIPGIPRDNEFPGRIMIFNRRIRRKPFEKPDWPAAYYLINGPPPGETEEMRLVREGLRNSIEESCNARVKAAIQLHKKYVLKNNDECPWNHIHTYLYEAGRVAEYFNLQNPKTVVDLLNEAFKCQKTLEGFISVVIFNSIRRIGGVNPRPTPYQLKISLQALMYFLDIGTQAKLQFQLFGNNSVRLIDECWHVCMRDVSSALVSLTQRFEVLRVLVEYGPEIQDSEFEMFCSNDAENQVFMFRNERVSESRKIIAAVRPSGVKGWPVPSLMHICRYVIRSLLASNFQLPHGPALLPLPVVLIRYLMLEELISIDEILGLETNAMLVP